MYVNFNRFLIALGIVGVAFGVVFGMGVATGRAQRPATATTSASVPQGTTGVGGATAGSAGAGGPGASATAPAGAAGAGGFGGAGGGFGAGGGAPVNGTIENVSATSMAVKTAAGETVTLTLNPQTTVRRIENGAVQDLKQGDQVLVTRDASSVATAVQIVPPGTSLGGPGAGRGPGAAGTPSGSATPAGTPRRGQ